MNLSLSGMSALMAPKLTALRRVLNPHRFDPLLARRIWWDKKEGDYAVKDRHVQRFQSQLIGYGHAPTKKRKQPTMAPPAESLERAYQLSGGCNKRMCGSGLNQPGIVGQGLRMAGMRGTGVPINLRNAKDINYL
jgi:hypothetical protein